MAYWNTSVQTFFLPHVKLWLSALKGIIAVFCGANLVCDENTFPSVILPTDRFLTDLCSFEIGYRWISTVRLGHICLNALLRERLRVNKCCSTSLNHAFRRKYSVGPIEGPNKFLENYNLPLMSIAVINIAFTFFLIWVILFYQAS